MHLVLLFRKWNKEIQNLEGLPSSHIGDIFQDPRSDSILENLSRIRVSVHTQRATKIVRSARVSFAGQLANLGKSK